MNDLDDYLPCPGEPGFRQDPETGERFYSSAWLGDFTPGEAPLAEALAIASGLATHPRVAELRAEHPADSEGAQVIALQARSRPVDGDIGPVGARRRSAPRDPSGRRVAPPEAMDLTEAGTLRRLAADAMASAARHLERLVGLADDPQDEMILRGRLRQQQILQAMFEDDA
jgi:hypothetical protein